MGKKTEKKKVESKKKSQKKVKDQNINSIIKTYFSEIVAYDLLKDVKKVLLKPNFVVGSPASCGATTDLDLIRCLISFFRKSIFGVIGKIFRKKIIYHIHSSNFYMFFYIRCGEISSSKSNPAINIITNSTRRNNTVS